MNLRQYRPLMEVGLCGIVLLIVHKVFLALVFPTVEAAFIYNVNLLYGFFTGCSLIITYILIKIRLKNIDNVGNTFMLLTFIKMGLAYMLLDPILRSVEAQSEKLNFFVIFALFLTLETIVTSRLLKD